MAYGICCIVLALEEQDPPKKFQKMTYAQFKKLKRNEAIEKLSKRILNNIDVTYEAIKFCHRNNFCYRMSSDLFPLITYEETNLTLEELPDYNKIEILFNEIKSFISLNKVRISCHPSEFNVLASKNEQAVSKTIKELNFYSKFMDKIGCEASGNCPMNLHINNKDGSYQEIIYRFMISFEKLDENCRKRLTIENDDKLNCWCVEELIEHFYKKTNIPICFDYLHHKCHPGKLSEEKAFILCKETWGNTKPLFHYSESKDEDNPRSHANLPRFSFNTYGFDIDVDFEFKMKDKAVAYFIKNKSAMEIK